jgi:phosphinothricin acetyltransferase
MHFEKLGEKHRRVVIDIFNHYIESDFSAYLLDRVPYEFYDMFLSVSRGYPAVAVISDAHEVAGFGMLRPYSPLPVFTHTAEFSCFLDPDATRQGTGGLVLRHLEAGAAEMNISVLLASISSKNEKSIRFHLKNGFTECGRFAGIGRKFNTDFDVVWMRKALPGVN